MQFDRRIAGIRVVNAGSVGMPFGRTGADWMLLGPDVHTRNTVYDLQNAAARIRETSYPPFSHISRPDPAWTRVLRSFSRNDFAVSECYLSWRGWLRRARSVPGRSSPIVVRPTETKAADAG